MDASQPHLTVVLPAYNEEASVGATIEAVLRFLRERGLSHEVVVVDDGSEDATASVVARVAGRHPAVRLVRHPANRGYGAALRTAFAAARGEWVACPGHRLPGAAA
ncbi:MAG: glycosyltransferase [Limnochordaceae bacterium]|nr:glycosyltransferase [Limnochordaceae bacterium]